MVYAQVTGLGLGVWLYSAANQRIAYVEAYQRVLEKLAPVLSNVAVIDFSWVANAPFDGSKLEDGKKFAGTDIVIKFSRRDPFAKLPSAHKDMLVVAMYAWDGNAFPGE